MGRRHFVPVFAADLSQHHICAWLHAEYIIQGWAIRRSYICIRPYAYFVAFKPHTRRISGRIRDPYYFKCSVPEEGGHTKFYQGIRR